MINEVMQFTDVFWLFFLEACVVFCVLVLFIDFFLSYGSFVRFIFDFAFIFVGNPKSMRRFNECRK
jgi:hypothetical protein